MHRSMCKLTRNLYRSFAHDGPVYHKAPKISEQQIWINVENPSGYLERIPGRIGKSLFEEIKNAKTSIGGFCNGIEQYNVREKPVEPNANAPDCDLCYVEVKEEWYSRLDIHPLEKSVLENDPFIPFNKYRRLACCITLEPWMNEMIVRIPFELPDSEFHLYRP